MFFFIMKYNLYMDIVFHNYRLFFIRNHHSLYFIKIIHYNNPLIFDFQDY